MSSSNRSRYLSKRVPPELIKFRSPRDSEFLYLETPFLAKGDCQPEPVQRRQPQSDSHNASRGSRSASAESTVVRRSRKRTATTLSAPAFSFLRLLLSLPHPFHLASELLTLAEITSGSARNALSRELQRHRLIVVHELQKQRSRAQLWEPSEVAYELLQLPKPRYRSKGGFLHQFIAHRISQVARSCGYRVQIEHLLANGKAVDVVLTKADEVIFVEIAVSPPLQKELENVVADFATEVKPSRLLFVTVNSKTRKELESLINSDPRTNVYKDKIRHSLAGDFIDTQPEVSNVFLSHRL